MSHRYDAGHTMDIDELNVLYNAGYDCSQSIIKAFEKDLGDDFEPLIKSTNGLGMGLLQGATCGGILGALVVIAHKFGNVEPDMSLKGLCMIKREQFFMMFKQKYPGVTCPELMGLDIINNEDNIKAYQQNVYTEKCPSICLDIIRMVEEITGYSSER